MKGPSGRSKFDLRRTWECPVCGRRLRTDGRVVHRLCECGARETPPRQIWMRLIEVQPKPPSV
jgi:hypothetical protein